MTAPESVSDALDHLADWLDLADRAFELLARSSGMPRPAMGTTVQADVRMWAAWLREHPDVDEAMTRLSSFADG